MINRHIKTIGIELEGGWCVSPPAIASVHHDGSISVDGLKGAGAVLVGEIASPVFNNMKALEAWLVVNHPSHVDGSCGLHVHFGLDAGSYARLMDETFRLYFIAEMEKYGRDNEESLPVEFYQRLKGGGAAGRTAYCSPVYDAEKQVKARTRENCRYGIWNFCWLIHGTAECRVLPMFEDSAASLYGIKTVAACVTHYLNSKSNSVSVDLELTTADCVTTAALQCDQTIF